MPFRTVLERISLRTSSFAVCALLSIAMAACLIGLERIHAEYDSSILQTAQSGSQLASLCSELSVSVVHRESLLSTYLLSGLAEDLDRYYKTSDESFTVIGRLMSFWTQSMSQEFVETLLATHGRVDSWQQEFAEPALAFRKNNRQGVLPAPLLERGRELSSKIRDGIAGLRKAVESKWQEAERNRLDVLRSQRVTILIVLVNVLIFCGLIFIAASHWLIEPLHRLNEATRQIIAGGAIELPTGSGFLELGQLFQNFTVMVQTLRSRESELRTSQIDTARSNEGLLTITQYAQFLNTSNNERDIGRALVGQVRKITGAPQIGFYLRSRLHPEFELIASHPPADDVQLVLRSSFLPEHCSVARCHQQLHVMDRNNELGWSCQVGCEKMRSELCIPIASGESVIGVLHLASATAVGWSNEGMKLVVSLVNFTAPTINNLRSLENMRERATRDPLTGLFNRRYAEEFLPIALEEARRNGTSHGLLMFDIDHFKQINDLHGHDAGDRILCDVGRIARETLRASDIVCRFGGEEFLVVLPRTNSAGAATIAEKLRERIAESHYDIGQFVDRVQVTISIGVADFPADGVEPTMLIKAADLALYRAKAAGRNRVKLFQENMANDAPANLGTDASASSIR